MENLIGLTLENAQADLSREVCVMESAPPIRPLRQNAPRKKSKQSEEAKASRVQSFGELRVLRVCENEKNLEVTTAREEAVSISFAAALIDETS